MKILKFAIGVFLFSQAGLAVTPDVSDISSNLQKNQAVLGAMNYAVSLYPDIVCGPLAVDTYEKVTNRFEASMVCQNKTRGIAIQIRGLDQQNIIVISGIDFGYSM